MPPHVSGNGYATKYRQIMRKIMSVEKLLPSQYGYDPRVDLTTFPAA
jgi:hypothetical protein